MKITMRSTALGPDIPLLEADKTYDLPDGFAKSLIEAGAAVPADPKPSNATRR